MKAADISVDTMLAAIRKDIATPRLLNDFHDPTATFLSPNACTWTIADREGWPVKVAMAKLRKMERQGLVDGCACGCRGDWTILEES